MIKLDINLESNAAAFEVNPQIELARIFLEFSQHIENGLEGKFLFRDVNGNLCGAGYLEIWEKES